MSAETGGTPGRLARLWRALRRPSGRWSVAALLILGGVGGVLFWGAFNTAMERTNTLAFCTSCHSMATPHEEYKKSAHFSNPSGVRAICSDCHVPRDWTAKVARKIYASRELWHHFTGKIDTPEKFEAHRTEMAERVWSSMKATDSRECRNCHSYDSMAFHKQTPRGREKMEEAKAKGQTCIECHKGVAHALPARDD